MADEKAKERALAALKKAEEARQKEYLPVAEAAERIADILEMNKEEKEAFIQAKLNAALEKKKGYADASELVKMADTLEKMRDHYKYIVEETHQYFTPEMRDKESWKAVAVKGKFSERSSASLMQDDKAAIDLSDLEKRIEVIKLLKPVLKAKIEAKLAVQGDTDNANAQKELVWQLYSKDSDRIWIKLTESGRKHDIAIIESETEKNKKELTARANQRESLNKQIKAYAKLTGMSDKERDSWIKHYETGTSDGKPLAATTAENLEKRTKEWEEDTVAAKKYQDKFMSLAKELGKTQKEAEQEWNRQKDITGSEVEVVANGKKRSGTIETYAKDLEKRDVRDMFRDAESAKLQNKIKEFEKAAEDREKAAAEKAAAEKKAGFLKIAAIHADIGQKTTTLEDDAYNAQYKLSIAQRKSDDEAKEDAAQAKKNVFNGMRQYTDQFGEDYRFGDKPTRVDDARAKLTSLRTKMVDKVEAKTEKAQAENVAELVGTAKAAKGAIVDGAKGLAGDITTGAGNLVKSAKETMEKYTAAANPKRVMTKVDVDPKPVMAKADEKNPDSTRAMADALERANAAKRTADAANAAAAIFANATTTRSATPPDGGSVETKTEKSTFVTTDTAKTPAGALPWGGFGSTGNGSAATTNKSKQPVSTHTTTTTNGHSNGMFSNPSHNRHTRQDALNATQKHPLQTKAETPEKDKEKHEQEIPLLDTKKGTTTPVPPAVSQVPNKIPEKTKVKPASEPIPQGWILIEGRGELINGQKVVINNHGQIRDDDATHARYKDDGRVKNAELKIMDPKTHEIRILKGDYDAKYAGAKNVAERMYVSTRCGYREQIVHSQIPDCYNLVPHSTPVTPGSGPATSR